MSNADNIVCNPMAGNHNKADLTALEIRTIVKDVMAEVERDRQLAEMIDLYNALIGRVEHIEKYLAKQKDIKEPAIGFQPTNTNMEDEEDE